MKIRSLALASLFVLSAASVSAVTLTENFATDPLAHGWKTFGNTNQFHWNPTNQNLEVTWNSTNVNSYCYLPLGYILTTNDDFTVAFDLRLDDVQAVGFGTQIAISLFKLSDATRTNFDRVVGADPVTGPRNLAEFDYFPFPGDETISPTMISRDDTGYDQWASGFFDPELLTNGVTFHISMAFTATNQALATVITYGDHQPWATFASVQPAASFKGFLLDTLAISSYDGRSDSYDATLAHGVVDNFSVTLPPPPVQNLSGIFSSGQWSAQFLSRSHWIYALERSADLQNWSAVTNGIPGNATNLFLWDANPTVDKGFYRIRADRP